MRLDHLLSMETGTGFHGSVVCRFDETVLSGREYRTFVVQFLEIIYGLTKGNPETGV